MKILVYGVTHWDSKEEAESKKEHLLEWYARINKFIPNVEKVFLTTGSYSDPNYNPLPCDLYQIKCNKKLPYTKEYNHFRYGFMIGIWQTLLNNYNFDLLIHCQTKILIGEDLSKYIEDFLKREEDVIMAPNFTSYIGAGIDVSFMCMKKPAIINYTQTGARQNFEIFTNNTLNCEDEAFLLFRNNWYNPWHDVLSIKEFDSSFASTIYADNNIDTPFKIKLNNFLKLPFISAVESLHSSKNFITQWKKLHPYQ